VSDNYQKWLDGEIGDSELNRRQNKKQVKRGTFWKIYIITITVTAIALAISLWG
jgi:hypothetical protein